MLLSLGREEDARRLIWDNLHDSEIREKELTRLCDSGQLELAVRYLENEDKGPDVERVQEYQRLAREYVEDGDSHVVGCIATTQQMLDKLMQSEE